MPKPNGRMGAPRPKNLKGTTMRILSYLKPYKWRMILVVVTIAIAAFCNVAGTYILSPLLTGLAVTENAIDTPLTGIPFVDQFAYPTSADLAVNLQNKFIYLAIMVGAIAVVYILNVICVYVYNKLLVKISTQTMKRMRDELFEHMQTLPIKVFDTHTHGELMSCYTNDIDMINEFLARCIPQLISSVLTIVGVFAVMFATSWQLTLVMIVMLVLMALVVKFVGGESKNNFVAQQSAVGKLNGYIEEMVEGQKVVKAFNHEAKALEGFDEINNYWQTVSARANAYANVLGPIVNNLSHFFYAGIAVFGAVLALNADQPLVFVGIISTFLLYIRKVTMPIQQISQQINLLFMAVAGGERVFALMDIPSEVDDGYVTLVNANIDENGNITESATRTGHWAWKHPHHDGQVTYTELRGDVRFEEVTFGYDENKTVLNDVSLYAKPGQKIAFVGSTGAGKTTITNLINRFYDVPDGKIRYDGININKIKKADLRRSLGMVLQDTHLFTGTVMDNIRYGRLDATDEECIAAAKSANAHQFIKHLPQGYNTVLTRDGENLSQGQRQLLAIARAAVADPPVLILDEATSSIDTRTEWLIEKGMDALMEGRTTFVIAHRLSTVRNSNAIMVLEQGHIIERGSHDDLIAQRGKYYQLYTGMFELS